ncbi:MFS transporter [Streptomyces sp. SID8360]|nr:drug resistance transporter, EmrB/QacA subfamily [Streptomyces sp. SirexAA-E]MYR70183.1 MFS transporter [Streptomyces sp. SID4939]MYS04495.1 MFS transporter [Streptomyces sp. SID4940]MYT64567.1 MFS transporter [Streptomyces sp. SID8357]MYT87380.1 MFS transporter [Streptomyces sp. SID8360]MYU34832.1 MFS transporter [Streptomyces sp. SID8358]MYW37057.1 MFS transporter [Streptomyces sp. SID1]MYX75754.1 MFS transporter [Streptomyces sp. SID3915]PZX45074.1 EmrB/QacA subfamily drug resistance 
MSAHTAAPAEAAPMDHRHVMRALSGLLIVLFVAMISSTVVSVALPQIIGSLNGTQSQYTWVVTATLLASTASTPIWGKLADLFSKKLLLQISIGLFVISSIACGFAQSTGQLIGFRVIQGLGMGALQVLVQVIIAAMISPKERGRYNGYLGGVMAVATVGGPLLGGFITDTSWLGWRWCFFIAIPFTVVAFVMLTRTLHLTEIRRPDVKVDYLGASLIAAGVSLLLLWVTFVDNDFAWVSWQTGVMVGASLLILAAAVLVESRVKEPVVPLHVVRRRDPALAIIASLAVGMAMFGGAVFLGQYFQIGRGNSPTEAGLLTIPLMLGVLISSTVAGRLVSKTGKVKPYIIAGVVVLTLGFLGLSTIDHETSLVIVSLGMLAVGMGVGMSMQNLVLVVQNTVPFSELGAASGSITFFRSLGGTIGVSVLGAVLANQVATKIAAGLTELGIDPAASSSGGSTLNIAAMPPEIQEVVRAAYGDATGHIFLISAGIALVGVVASLFLTPTKLRDSVDL